MSNEETPVQSNSKEDNLVAIRRMYEQEREARIQAEKLAAEREAQLRYQPLSAKQVDSEDDDDPYVDNKKLARKLSAFEQELEKKIEAKAEAKARALLAEKEQSEFIKSNRDFESVMTSDNLDRFAQEHPLIAENLLRMPNNFERQKLVYATIKSLQREKENKSNIQNVIAQKQTGSYYQPSGIGHSAPITNSDFSSAGQAEAYNKLQELKSRLRIG